MSLKDVLVYDQESERHHWVQKQLASLQAGSKLLDAGCGPQIYRNDCAKLQYSSQDFGGYVPGGDGTGLQMPDWQYGKIDYVCDIWNIPEKDAKFDTVICTEVLEHVPYPRETIVELARLLKPGGLLILTVPYACLPHMSPYFFSSGYSREFYEHVFAQCGLQTEEMTPCGNGFYYVGQEIVRLRAAIRNPVLRALYLVLLGPLLLLMRGIGSGPAGPRAEALPFGYFIRAVKLVGTGG